MRPSRHGSQGRFIRFAPLLCIEVLSSDDTLRDIQLRAEDYSALAVQHVWAIDPWKRLGYSFSNGRFEQPADGVLRVPETPIAVSLLDLFSELDEE